ncbi:hypothetical protein NHN26_11175 [Rhodovulum tesquicola]|uniref:hypothetical protein n=1 Tax=Rhodovulum tesquicola TaxID=540254 RepID=UPI0020974FCD|nr:hypothetical protein [Rhodovulum tesquicola]MCO8145790.1 hypothetical protein [Rhodovulum tesquicola]
MTRRFTASKAARGNCGAGTAKHFHRPAQEFDRLRAPVRPGGWLAFQTCFQTGESRFVDRHCSKDPTHLVFDRAWTFRFPAEDRGWACELPVMDLALLRRPETGA